MPAKAVKNKRGRPRKAAFESMVPETSKPAKGIRIGKKSTKSSTPEEVSGGVVKLTTKGASATTQSTPKTVSQASQSPLKSPATFPPTIISSEPKVAPPQLNAKLGNTKILNQVHALSSKPPPTKSPSAEPGPPTKPGNTPPKACVDSSPSRFFTSQPPTSRFLKPPSQPPTSRFPKPPSQPPASRFPEPPSQILPGNPPPSPITVVVRSTLIAAAKPRAVSQRGLRRGMKAAGAYRASGGANELPPNYKSVARKVTRIIVALPIAIVASWLLYERLMLGKERKVPRSIAARTK